MIEFFQEDIDFNLENSDLFADWIERIINSHQKKIDELNYIFCSDAYLLSINQAYLQHDDYTDIITFDLSDEDEVISGEIYCSIDRIKENAHDLGIEFDLELKRVMIHGVLHLIGFGDKSPSEKELMRKKESLAIEAFNE